jgi:hypothetical protein
MIALARIRSPKPMVSSISLHVQVRCAVVRNDSTHHKLVHQDLNVGAKLFYEKLGFQVEQHLYDHYNIDGQLRDALLLRKAIPHVPGSVAMSVGDAWRGDGGSNSAYDDVYADNDRNKSLSSLLNVFRCLFNPRR